MSGYVDAIAICMPRPHSPTERGHTAHVVHTHLPLREVTHDRKANRHVVRHVVAKLVVPAVWQRYSPSRTTSVPVPAHRPRVVLYLDLLMIVHRR